MRVTLNLTQTLTLTLILILTQHKSLTVNGEPCPEPVTLNLTPSHLVRQAIDDDGSGELDYTEFVRAVKDHEKAKIAAW